MAPSPAGELNGYGPKGMAGATGLEPAASAVTAAPESLYSTLQDRGTAKGPPKSFRIAQDVACRGLDCGFSKPCRSFAHDDHRSFNFLFRLR